MIPCAGFLDFLPSPTQGKKASSTAQKLVDRLLELSEKTNGGVRTTPAVVGEIEQIVGDLEKYCPKSPLRSDLIFGEWELLFTTKPQATGGPLRSPAGQVFCPGQKATQTIAPPNVCINKVSFKTLGFIPGAVQQQGELEPVDDRTYQLLISNRPSKDSKDTGRRVVETLYLDDRLRIAQSVPNVGNQEGALFVFRKAGVTGPQPSTDASKEKPSPKQTVKPPKQTSSKFSRGTTSATDSVEEKPNKFSLAGTQFFSLKPAGMATQAERSYAQRSGTQRRSSTTNSGAPIPQKGRKTTSDAKKTKQAMEDERRKAREAAAKAKAEAEEERRRARERAQAEKAEAAARRAAAREQYDMFVKEATAAAAEARSATSMAKNAERETSRLVRAASTAEAKILDAVDRSEQVAAELTSLKQQQAQIEANVKSARDLVDKLQRQLRKQEDTLAPKIRKA